METGEVIHEKILASPRPPPKISLEHDWMKDVGSEVARQSEGEVARQAKTHQANQTQTQIMIENWDRLFALNEERLYILKKSKHVLFVKKLWHTIERGNLLFAVMQITSAQC